jgi:predicted outer membrane repeat protein
MVPAPAHTAQPIVFSAHVTGCANGVCPEGTVSIEALALIDNQLTYKSVCAAATVSGSMTCSGTLDQAGTYQISAMFDGNLDFAPSSAAASLVVRTESPTAVASSVNPSVFGQAVTFTASVADPSGTNTPTGGLTFLVDGNVGAIGVLDGAGTFTMTTSALPVGIHAITANYAGDGTFAASNATIMQWVSGICRVKQGAQGSNDGSSWTNAFTDLQSALTNPGCTEVWVAAGTYTPSGSGDRTKRFEIGRDVGVYGGFAGSETQRSQRDPRANPTVLSGDLGGVNSYHVVWMDGTTAAGKIDADTVLDGFTITGGNANGNGRDDRGGGLTCAGDGVGHACSPTLTNLRFTGNRARFGGAMLLEGSNAGASDPNVINVTFDHNTATSNGGAVYNSGYAGSSHPTYANVTFFGNTASGVYAGSGYGGAVFNDFRNSGQGNPAFFNVTFSANSAAKVSGGGAIYSQCGVPANSGGLVLINAIAWNDSAAGAANEIGSDCSMSPVLDHSVVAGGCPLLGACTSLFTTDPQLGPLQDNGGQAPTLQPGSSGSAIANGSDSVCVAEPVNGLDQRGVMRPQLGHCDIGAIELTDLVFAYGFQ